MQSKKAQMLITYRNHFHWRHPYHDYISWLDRDFIMTSGFKGIQCSVIHHFYILLRRNCKWAFFCLQKGKGVEQKQNITQNTNAWQQAKKLTSPLPPTLTSDLYPSIQGISETHWMPKGRRIWCQHIKPIVSRLSNTKVTPMPSAVRLSRVLVLSLLA